MSHDSNGLEEFGITLSVIDAGMLYVIAWWGNAAVLLLQVPLLLAFNRCWESREAAPICRTSVVCNTRRRFTDKTQLRYLMSCRQAYLLSQHRY